MLPPSAMALIHIALIPKPVGRLPVTFPPLLGIKPTIRRSQSKRCVFNFNLRWYAYKHIPLPNSLLNRAHLIFIIVWAN